MEGSNHIFSLRLLCMVLTTLFISSKAQLPLIPTIPLIQGKSCGVRLLPSYGEEIATSIFQNTGEVTKYCCDALVGLGRECHDSWVNAVLISGKYENVTEIIKKSSKVWNACAPDTKGAPLCKKMTDGVCGREIIASIFHNTGIVIEPCCEALVGRGRECHNALVNARIASGGYENNATQVLKKSLQVWNACASTVIRDLPLKCEKTKVGVCGKEIVMSVFHNIGNVTETCCDALMDLGKECHETLVNAHIISGGYEKNATEVLKRSMRIWDRCIYSTWSEVVFECEKVKDGICGKQIVASVFHNKGQVSPNCCKELVERGKECHDTLVNEHVTSGRFENNATKVLRKSLEVWNGCSLTVKTSSAICTKMKDGICGKQIVMSIFENKGQVTKKCCKALIDIGKKCHDALVDNHILSKGLQNNSTEILKRSSEVWTRCV